ncbi:VirD4-like conjugal transfer protein, CD1115 family [Lactococcus formosensis subsp. bovis]|uniref:VirD4-like conjugal transfer protein, CD1115 family n=1 Tax=Lactococcus formosensis TaxID=1281486 RepID=UPI001BCF8EBE|nr:type IV secretory system conjugative DNA transfer family protein [Lactococcus formosensis]
MNLKNNTVLKKVGAFLYLGLFIPIFIQLWKVYDWKTSDKRRFKNSNPPSLQIKSKSWLIYAYSLATLMALLLSNFLTHALRVTLGNAGGSFAQLISNQNITYTFDWDIFSLSHLFDFELIQEAPTVIAVLFALFCVILFPIVLKYYKDKKDYSANEEGDDRLITYKELKKTYKKIPNRGRKFKGYGGMPVAHELRTGLSLSKTALSAKMKCHFPRLDTENITKGNKNEFVDKNDTLFRKGLAQIGKYVTTSEKILGLVKDLSGYYYIDDATINSIIVGMTRSGKGETVVNILVDILSRAQKQSAMVIADPKGELYQMSYDTLVKRGYDVEVLNFQNMDWSMSYNPLQPAIDYAQKGYYEKVQQEVDAVAQAFYKIEKEDGNSKFWTDSSINLFSALAIAIIWRAKETSEWDSVTLRQIVTMLNQMGSEEVWADVEGDIYETPLEDGSTTKQSKLTAYFNQLRKINKIKPSQFLTMADDSFRQSNFAGEETKGSIFSSMLSGLKLFMNDSIARMTSENNLDLTSIGFPRKLSIKFRASSDLSKENPYLHEVGNLTIVNKRGKAVVKKTQLNVDSAGYMNFAFDPILPDKFSIKIELPSLNLKAKIDVQKRYGKIKSILIDEKNTSKELYLEASDIDLKYSEKPKAVFMVMPPNRSAYDQMVALFIDQVFNANYDMALETKGRKTVQRIHFILDEVGNLPPIPGMKTKISIGLGQNLLFNLFIQNLEQLDAVYGKETAQTILGNCSINQYIKSNSDDTLKRFESLSGNKTVMTRQKTTNQWGLPSWSYQPKQQPVVSKGQLQKLQSGEAFISISVQAENMLGQLTSNLPILATGKLKFPHRYMFLHEEFDQGKSLGDIPVQSKHRYLKLSQVSVDWTEQFEQTRGYINDLQGNGDTNQVISILGRRKSAA